MSTARDVEADERRMQLFDELCKTGEINGHPAGEYFVDAVLTAKHYILALRLERERREWQPIETAPKDTLVIMALIRRGKLWRVCDGIRSALAWYDQNGDRVFEPTHWMPLPPPPEALSPS
jgi:hypothetical protein